MTDKSDAFYKIYKDSNILAVYNQCNIILLESVPKSVEYHWLAAMEYRWLAAMGMLDTLDILGIKAGMWDGYDE